MRIVSLYSGSGGNATYLRLGGTAILVDAGKSARTLCNTLREIGSDIDEIQAIFLTHEHNDHTSALATLLKKHPIPLHIISPCEEKMRAVDPLFPAASLQSHPPVYTAEVGGISVTSFPTPHDSAGSVGFRFTFNESDITRSVGFATDVGWLSEEVTGGLYGCEAVIIESNHDIEMLRSGPYPYDLKKRILSRRGHLSNTDCAILASRLAASGTKHILLAHLSEQNNTPAIAFDEVGSAIAGYNVDLAVASPDTPTVLIDEAPKNSELSEN